MKWIAGACLVLCLLTSPGAACTVEEALSDLRLERAKRGGEIAQQQLPILEKLDRIGARAKQQDKPLDQQLTPSEVAEYSRLAQRLASGQLMQLLESGYDRDIRLIGELVVIANKKYLGAREPQTADDPEFNKWVLLAVLQTARERASSIESVTVPEQRGGCDFEGAVHLVENDAFTKLNSLPIKDATRAIDEIHSRNPKTPEGWIDRSKLSMKDRGALERIERNVMAPAQREKNFIADLEAIKSLIRASALKFEAAKKDAVDSGGDIESVGYTVDHMTLNDDAMIALGLLKKIAETYPSQWSQQMESMANVTRALKNSAPLNLQPPPKKK